MIHHSYSPREQAESKSTGQYYETLKSLPFFSAFSQEEFQDIFQKGHIKKFHKGNLLFQEGEQANRLHIILVGFVKIFKGISIGDEAVIHILGAGSPILESSVFFNTTFSASAQVVEDATLFSLPGSLIIEKLKNNNNVAIDFLKRASINNQELICHIANTQLKSVDERIGSFLLKIMIEQKFLSQDIKLPYSKSTVAAHLNMKRETLSRALKRLKEKRFRLKNNTITIPNPSALCEFCESSICAKCSQRNTNHFKKCP